MTLTGKPPPEMSHDQAQLVGLIESLQWQHPSEHSVTTLGRGDLRVIIYPDISQIIATVRADNNDTLLPELEPTCQEIAMTISQWEDGVHFALLTNDDAAVGADTGSQVQSLASLAQGSS
jgi:hypothetical protein